MNKLVLNKAFLCLQPRTHNVGSLQDSCCFAHAMSLTLPPQRARRSIINGGSLTLLCSCFTSRVHSASAQKAVSIHCSIKNITLATCQDVLLDDCHSRRSAFLPREGPCPASSVNAPCGAFCFLATPPCNFVATVFVHLPKQPHILRLPLTSTILKLLRYLGRHLQEPTGHEAAAVCKPRFCT